MRRLFTAAVMCLLIALPNQVRGDDKQGDQKNKQTALTISPETTKIVAPLDERGFVDYVEAANQLRCKGITPTSNYETVVRQVMGPQEIPESVLEEYYQRIGIEPPEGPFLQSYEQFKQEQAKDDDDLQDDLFEIRAGDEKEVDEFDQVLNNPWSAEVFPEVDQWLRKQHSRLDKLVEGSKRPHYYTPYVVSAGEVADKSTPRILQISLDSLQGQRQVAWTLAIRANGNIQRGNLDAAWSDIQAIYRISRLCAQGITLIEQLVATAIDQMAFDAAARVLKSTDLTVDQRRRFAADLNQLPALPPMSVAMDIGERWMALDALQQRVKTGTIANWDVAAILINQWYDQLVEAMAEPDFRKRYKLLDKIETDLEGLGKDLGTPLAGLSFLLAKKPKDEMGRRIGQQLIGLVFPASGAIHDAYNMGLQRLDVIRAAYAIEIFRAETGAYPKQLAQLPTYAEQVPIDRFSAKPLIYRPAADAFVVYSVGRNQKDDSGRSYYDRDDRTEYDDIAVRIESK